MNNIRTLWLELVWWRRLLIPLTAILLAILVSATSALAHAVTEGDKGYIMEISGTHLIPFTYLGAKHMVTGYDHLLFLFEIGRVSCRERVLRLV